MALAPHLVGETGVCYYIIRVDFHGREIRDVENEGEYPSHTLSIMLSRENYTDVILVTRGFHTSQDASRESPSFDDLFEKIVEVLPAGSRPLLIALHWPTIPKLVSSRNSEEEIIRDFESVAELLSSTDTKAAKSLRNLVEAAQSDSLEWRDRGIPSILEREYLEFGERMGFVFNEREKKVYNPKKLLGQETAVFLSEVTSMPAWILDWSGETICHFLVNRAAEILGQPKSMFKLELLRRALARILSMEQGREAGCIECRGIQSILDLLESRIAKTARFHLVDCSLGSQVVDAGPAESILRQTRLAGSLLVEDLEHVLGAAASQAGASCVSVHSYAIEASCFEGAGSSREEAANSENSTASSETSSPPSTFETVEEFWMSTLQEPSNRYFQTLTGSGENLESREPGNPLPTAEAMEVFWTTPSREASSITYSAVKEVTLTSKESNKPWPAGRVSEDFWLNTSADATRALNY